MSIIFQSIILERAVCDGMFITKSLYNVEPLEFASNVHKDQSATCSPCSQKPMTALSQMCLRKHAILACNAEHSEEINQWRQTFSSATDHGI